MIVTDKSAAARLNSPMNLMNRMSSLKNIKDKKKDAMSLFIRPSSSRSPLHPSNKPATESSQAPQESDETPDISLDSIIENHEAQIKLGLAHDQSLDLLTRSLNMLSTKLDDVKADKLPAVISAASKTVESIRRERLENSKNTKDREVHYHFYTPEKKALSDYSIIDVGAADGV